VKSEDSIEVVATSASVKSRGRGRPKGSKNKKKTIASRSSMVALATPRST
jgi:hypothetical protein